MGGPVVFRGPSVKVPASPEAASLKGFINNITQYTVDASVEILLVDEHSVLFPV